MVNSYLLSENIFCRLRHSLTHSDGIQLNSDESVAFILQIHDFPTKFRSFSQEKVYFAQLCLGNQERKKRIPEMASTAPGAGSNERSGSAGAQLNRRKDGEKPSAGTNTVLCSPLRAHDPRKKQLKLPPGAAPVMITGNHHTLSSVAIDFVDGILDHKSRSL